MCSFISAILQFIVSKNEMSLFQLASSSKNTISFCHSLKGSPWLISLCSGLFLKIFKWLNECIIIIQCLWYLWFRFFFAQFHNVWIKAESYHFVDQIICAEHRITIIIERLCNIWIPDISMSCVITGKWILPEKPIDFEWMNGSFRTK